MAKKKKIDSAADLHAKVLDFIGVCEESGDAPTDFALWSYLGVRPSEWDNLIKGKNKDGRPWEHCQRTDEGKKVWEERDKRETEDALKKLTAFREDRLVRQLEASKNANTNAIFQLKQAKNGGYQDVQTTDNNAAITIKIDGIGGLESFK